MPSKELNKRIEIIEEIINEFTKCDTEDCTGCKELGKCLGRAIAVLVWLLRDKIDWEIAQAKGMKKLMREEKAKEKISREKDIGSMFQ